MVLREAWEKTSYELEKLSYNQSYVVKDYEARMKMAAPQWELSYTPLATKSALLCSPNKYRVCILREEVGIVLGIISLISLIIKGEWYLW